MAKELRSWRYLGLTALLALTYFAAAVLGLSLASEHTNVSPVWPPTGIAIASLLLFGHKFWPALIIGAFAVNSLTNINVPTAAGIAVGNTLEAVSAYYFLRSHDDSRKSLVSVSDVFRFILYAVIISPMVSATIGNLSLCLGHAALWNDFGYLWLTWWLGDGIGALVFAPFLLAWGSGEKITLSRRSVRETGLLLASLFIVSMVIFAGWFPGSQKTLPLAHMALPFMLWAAYRFDLKRLTLATVLLSGVAIWGISHGYGPFLRGGPNQSLLLLQAFVGSTTITSYILFALKNERRRVQREKLELADQVALHRERIEDIVAHIPGVVWEAWGKPEGPSQRTDFVSRYVEKMLGYRVEEWLSTPNFWLSIVHPDDRSRTAHEAAQIFASGKGGVIRFRWVAKNGAEIWVEAQSVVVCDEHGRPVGMRGVTMDISSNVRAEQERVELLLRERLARADAEEASRLKDDFLATVSHELRTPINAIVGWSRLLRSGQLDSDALAHALEVIERNALSQKLIIEDMLDVSRIITGKLRVGLSPVDLSSVIKAAINVLHPAAEAKGVSILTGDDLPKVLVHGDADRLQQVFWNLLSNAVKFTSRGGIVEVSLAKREVQVEIGVSDTGPGIPEEFLPHVFERFSQGDSSSTGARGGLGLGLAIARHLVELHGGSIAAENRKDRSGARFTVVLPYSDERREARPTNYSDAPSPTVATS